MNTASWHVARNLSSLKIIIELDQLPLEISSSLILLLLIVSINTILTVGILLEIMMKFDKSH
jgi:hypothetical protein